MMCISDLLLEINRFTVLEINRLTVLEINWLTGEIARNGDIPRHLVPPDRYTTKLL